MTETTSPVARGCTECGRTIIPGSRYFIDCSGPNIKRLCRECERPTRSVVDRKLPTASRP